jgi:Protein of unknown function (DUF2782)
VRPIRSVRLLLTLMFALIALPAAAADALPNLQPIPEPPPMPAGAVDADLEPEVTITQRGQDKVEEYRQGGKLYMVKVTPPHGTPYYLVDEQGDGVMTRKDTLTSGTRPPMWVIKRW